MFLRIRSNIFERIEECYFQLENDCRTLEMSLILNVNFHSEILA